MKIKITTIIAFLCFINLTKAQQVNIDSSNLISDTEKIGNEFFDPAFKGLIYSMNSGWYHTAKVHKKFGFDITIGASASIIPSKDEVFNLLALNLSNNTQVINGTANSATIAGGDSAETIELSHTAQANGSFNGQSFAYDTSLDFELPSGVKDDLPLNAVPAPSIQVALGLPYKFEIIARIIPEIEADDVKANLFGLGIKKEITQIFGPLEKTPLHVSILAAFTKMKVDYAVDEINEENIEVTNGNIAFDLTSYTIQAIASLDIKFINVYGGFGFNGGKSTLDLEGEYTLQYEGQLPTGLGLPNSLSTVEDTVTNPFSLSTNVSGFNATIGTRLSLGFFKIFGSYTLQEYNSINAGIAFSFR